jgi:hypothetical protein
MQLRLEGGDRDLYYLANNRLPAHQNLAIPAHCVIDLLEAGQIRPRPYGVQ